MLIDAKIMMGLNVCIFERFISVQVLFILSFYEYRIKNQINMFAIITNIFTTIINGYGWIVWDDVILINNKQQDYKRIRCRVYFITINGKTSK
jgi:hypothetical protein